MIGLCTHNPRRIPALEPTPLSSPSPHPNLQQPPRQPFILRQQPSCRTARRSSSGRARGSCPPTRPRSGTPWTISRSPRKSVHPMRMGRHKKEEDIRPAHICPDDCDDSTGILRKSLCELRGNIQPDAGVNRRHKSPSNLVILVRIAYHLGRIRL